MENIVIVTRHPALVKVLREDYGIDGEVLEHATPDDVRGRVVVGVLPLHLAALAERVITPMLHLAPEDRGRELSAEEVRERLEGLQAYKVNEVTLKGVLH